MSLARILFIPSELNFTYDVQVLFVSIQSGTVDSISEFFAVCDIISKRSGYKICPGLQKKMYFDKYYAIIRYHIKRVQLWDKPFDRIDSDNCLLWHQLAKNVSTKQKSMFAVLCKSCKRLLTLLEHQKGRSDVSPARRIARQQPSSSFKLKYLSPASVTKRKKATQIERSTDKAKLAKLTNTELLLDDTSGDELQKVFQEADRL